MTTGKTRFPSGVSRRSLLRQAVATGAGLGAFSVGGASGFDFLRSALAEDHPPLGTWPDGSEGSSVTIGPAVPLTGAYAESGADELKGWELAVEHLNEGNELIKKIAPKVSKGLLGKTVKLVSADSAAKPNNAVQVEQTFIEPRHGRAGGARKRTGQCRFADRRAGDRVAVARPCRACGHGEDRGRGKKPARLPGAAAAVTRVARAALGRSDASC